MSYFATFYSYKGGVGRTLALANVAWLLANHPTEPARVLTIDFDLGAPGLFQVFGTKRASKSLGIVDYVTTYLQKARIPDVTEYIHKTVYNNIDILPAGQMDSRYQRRLESIDWKRMYEGAFGYELIERLKSDISAISPEYDYVLIDSLTGYSDVGGICVNQFPDTLLLLFRLNQQNLNGIGNVFRALKPRSESELSRSVIPVITPSWPFIDDAASKWISRAQELFPDNKLLEISFDSSLSFGERIISEKASTLPFNSKVLVDYKSLTDEVRERNTSDPLTIWKKIHSSELGPLVDKEELFLRLLRRRPNVLEYWGSLPMAFGYQWLPRTKKLLSDAAEKLLAFTNQEADAGNKYALLGRARIGALFGYTRNQSKEDLNKALLIDPDFFDALVDRGRLSYQLERYNDAIADFTECLRRHPSKDIRVGFLLAQAYLRLFKAREALDAIDSAISHAPKAWSLYLVRAKARYLLGDYSAALADARLAAKGDYVGLPESFLPSQILAAMGQIDEAKQELERLSKPLDDDSRGNLAEAYLAVDPEKTINLLKGTTREPVPAVRKLLTILARIFRGDDINTIAPEVEAPADKQVTGDKWDVFEVTAILRAKERSRTLSPKAIELAYEAISKTVKSKEPAGISEQTV